LESELFGHEKGSFTGAVTRRRGIFEQADHGTLFLDEIGEASLTTQVKLLRALEKPDELYRVGGEHPYKSDVRLIAATNVDLKKAVEQGKFRKDLYFRLKVINLSLPSLRERKEDIPLLIQYFTKFKFNNPDITFSTEAMEVLVNYNWPGNVRELINVLAHVLALTVGNIVYPNSLPLNAIQQEAPQGSSGPLDKAVASLITNSVEKYLVCKDMQDGLDLSGLIQELKLVETKIVKTVIYEMLNYTKGNQGEAASMLGVNNRRLQYYLNEK
jgi:two-component system NtrC family response regulator